MPPPLERVIAARARETDEFNHWLLDKMVQMIVEHRLTQEQQPGEELTVKGYRNLERGDSAAS